MIYRILRWRAGIWARGPSRSKPRFVQPNHPQGAAAGEEQEMSETADAVVIGAGVNGASIAFNLMRRGMQKMIVVEKYLLASGGTGKSAAVIRQHYSNEPLVRMMKRSIEIFVNFAEMVGGSAGFHGTGWAFLVPSESVSLFRQNLAMQQRIGIRTREISREELLDIEPRFNLEDVATVGYEPESGYADPTRTTASYLQAACRRGAKLQQGSSVTSIGTTGNRVTEVVTSRGRISTPIVVNAAGPWADRVAEMVGLSIPIEVSREQEILVAPPADEKMLRLAVSDMAKAIYYRPVGHQLLVGRGFPKEYEYVNPDRFRETIDFDFVEETKGRLNDRLPAYTDSLVIGGKTGLYDITPDWHPVLGPTPVDGFFVAAGFSGHGFKLGPAIGELMAEEIVDGKASGVDISGFRLDRFAGNKLFVSSYGGNRA